MIGLGQRGRRWQALVLALGLGVPAAAHAEVTIRPSTGWARDDDGEAMNRVRRWFTGREDARIVAVYTPTAQDGFAEVVALLEVDGPFGKGDAQEVSAALAGMPGVDDAEVVREDFADGAQRVRASWTDDRLTYRADLVASGDTRTVLVQAALTSEAPLYGRTFSEVSDSLTGAAMQRVRFDRGAWRMRTLLVGGLGIAAAFSVAMWRRPMNASARTIGRIIAGLCVALAVLAALLTLRAMTPRMDELRAAGVSAETLSAEVATWGLLAAVVTWVLGVWFARREGPVASAPLRGSFADRSSGSMVSVPIIPQVPKRDSGPHPGMSRRHPDGASRLDPVTVPPGSGLPPVNRPIEE